MWWQASLLAGEGGILPPGKNLPLVKPQHSSLILRTLLAALALATGVAAGQSTTDSTTMDYSSFQIIPQRNIFDPNRYPRGNETYHRQRPQGVPTFSLAGTMSYRRGMLAFFNGTDPDYQKVVEAGGTIAGYTVTNITMSGAQLLLNGKAVDLKVGAAMQQDGDSWVLDNSDVFTMPSMTGSGDSSTQSPASGAAPPAGADSSGGNDVLKRLMQQRQQELK